MLENLEGTCDRCRVYRSAVSYNGSGDVPTEFSIAVCTEATVGLKFRVVSASILHIADECAQGVLRAGGEVAVTFHFVDVYFRSAGGIDRTYQTEPYLKEWKGAAERHGLNLYASYGGSNRQQCGILEYPVHKGNILCFVGEKFETRA